MTTSDDPQSPQTLNPTDQTEDYQETIHEVDEEEEEEEEDEEQQQQPNAQPSPEEGKSFSLPSPDPQKITDTQVVVTTMALSAKRSSSRRRVGGGGKKRKRCMRPKAVEALRKKFLTLIQNLKPIPFKPKKSLDFLSHEKLLRRIGLWEFVNLELECNSVRTDLIAQLIVGFDRKNRHSEVNGVKIKVSRTDLARALRLPLPVKGVTLLNVSVDTDDVDVSSKESIGFVNELVSNWMLLHEEMWMGPQDVFNWTKMIEEGHADKVEWASLVWFMVERELSQGPSLRACYYASHLQYLMKCQCEKIFLEDPKVEVVSVRVDDDEDLDGDEQENPEEGEDASLVKMESEDDVDALAVIEHEENGGGDAKNCDDDDAGLKTTEVESDKKMGDTDAVVNESKGDIEMTEVECDGNTIENAAEMNRNETVLQHDKIEELSVELTLGKDNSEKELDKGGDAMSFEECRVENAVKFSFDTQNSMSEHFLQPCSFDMIDRGLNFVVQGKLEEEEEPEEDDVEEQDHHDGDFNLSSKHITFQEMGSSNLMQAPDLTEGPYSSSMQLHNQSEAGYHMSRGETSTAIFGTAKRSIDHDSEVTHEHLNDSNKRLRSNGSWDDDKVFDFETCMVNFHHSMQNMQHWMEKARMINAAKESVCEDLTMNNQLLLDQLQQRTNMIEHLQKSKYDMHQKSQAEIYRLERELFVMGDILKSYRKALKENNRAFREYRARYQVPEEPMYKDVPGSGGLVLSVTELEKQRLRKEEEERIKAFEDRTRREEEDRIRREAEEAIRRVEEEAIRREEEDTVRREEQERIKMEEEDRMKRMQIEVAAKNIETEFMSKLESHLNKVDMLSGKITEIEKDVKVVKDAVAMNKASSEVVRSPDE